MHPERLMTQRCSLTLRTADDAGARDEYGNPVPATVMVPDVPCLLQQVQNVTLNPERGQVSEIQSDTYRVLLPASISRFDEDDIEIDVDPWGVDAIEVDGASYEMAGPPWRVFYPWSEQVTHVEATMRRSA